MLDPYVPYLLGRWEEGCRDGKLLLREIRERGCANRERTFIRFTAELRRAEAAGKPPSSTPRAKKDSVAGLSPTVENVAGLFMRREEKLFEGQREYLGRLCASDAALADARRLTVVGGGCPSPSELLQVRAERSPRRVVQAEGDLCFAGGSPALWGRRVKAR